MRHTGHLLALALAAGLLGNCGDGGTGPSEPAMPQGTLLLFDPRGPVHVADAATGTSREISRFGEPLARTSSMLGPGGLVASGGSTGVNVASKGLRLVDLSSGTAVTLAELPSTAGVFATKLSPTGSHLLFGAVGWIPGQIALMLMDVSTRQTQVLWIAPTPNPEQYLADLRWLPDGSGFIAHLGEGGTANTAQIVHFDLATATITPVTQPQTTLEMIRTLDLSPDGQTIAFNTVTGELRFISRSGSPAPGFPTDLRGVLPAFSPDGKLLAWSRYRDDTTQLDGVWYYRFSDKRMWRALPADSPLTWVLDWE